MGLWKPEFYEKSRTKYGSWVVKKFEIALTHLYRSHFHIVKILYDTSQISGADLGEGAGGMPLPGPIKISHKKDGRRR